MCQYLTGAHVRTALNKNLRQRAFHWAADVGDHMGFQQTVHRIVDRFAAVASFGCAGHRCYAARCVVSERCH